MNRYSVELITEITVDAVDHADAERIAEEMTVRVLYDPRIVATKPAYVGLIHAVSSDDDTEATMKAFDPIAAGFDRSPDFDGLFTHSVSLNRRLDLRDNKWSWKVTVVDGNFRDGYTYQSFHIPAKFDHNTVVALLRANGADIPEASDE